MSRGSRRRSVSIAPAAHFGRFARDGQERQRSRRVRRIDLPEELDGDLLVGRLAAGEDRPDRRDGTRVGDALECLRSPRPALTRLPAQLRNLASSVVQYLSAFV